MVNYCKCGCETEIDDDKTYAHGHNRKGVSSWNKGMKMSNDHTDKQIKGIKKHHENHPEWAEKQRQTMLANFQNPDFKERHHLWYNDEDPDDGVVMLSPYSHRHGHTFLKACGVEIEHINVKEKML